jgi:hypothetical protein
MRSAQRVAERRSRGFKRQPPQLGLIHAVNARCRNNSKTGIGAQTDGHRSVSAVASGETANSAPMVECLSNFTDLARSVSLF